MLGGLRVVMSRNNKMWCVEKKTGSVFYQGELIGVLGGSETTLLCAMLAEAGRTFSKDELLDLGWPNKIVAPNSLTVAIKNIRKIFGYRPSQLNIKTKHGQGYVLLAPPEGEIVVVEEFGEPSESAFLGTKSSDEKFFSHEVSVVAEPRKARGLLESLKFAVRVCLLVFLLMFSLAITIYDKRVYCESINNTSFCGTRPLAYSERIKLQNGDFHVEDGAKKYIYGYNHTTKIMVFYPLY